MIKANIYFKIFFPKKNLNLFKFNFNTFVYSPNLLLAYFSYFFNLAEINKHEKKKQFFFFRVLCANELDFCYLIYRHSFSNIFFTALTFWGKVIYTNSGGQASFAFKQTKRGKTSPDTVITMVKKVVKRLKNFD